MMASWAPWWDVVALAVVAGCVVVLWSIGSTVRRRSRADRDAKERARRAWRYGDGASVSWLDDQRGAAAVEAALVLPVLLLVALGGIDVGLLVVDAGLAGSTASEVCRATVAGEPYEQAVLSPVSGGEFAVSVVSADGWVTVEVTHSRPSFAPMIPGDRTVARTAACWAGEVTS